jgi:tRNA threonylcarbamoyl adenosine modification protein YeaZ
MIILASDTSTKSLSVAICDGEKVLSSVTRQTGMTHSQTHMPLICEMLAKAGLDFADVDVYACTNGPGSYTGIRIGVVSTKAMAYASGKSAVGVSTIETLAQPFKGYNHRIVCPLIDARNRRAFSAVFLGDRRILDEGNYSFDEILEFIDGFTKTMASESATVKENADTNADIRVGESTDIRKNASSKVDKNEVVVATLKSAADTGFELIFCGDAADNYRNEDKTLDTLNALKESGLLDKYDFYQTDPDAVEVAKIARKRILKFMNSEIERLETSEILIKREFNPMLLKAVYISASNAERMIKKEKIQTI